MNENVLVNAHNETTVEHEHIQEVLDKWTQIDDEIWAKVIVFERNRRVAKAYARAPVLTINGSDDGFDGMR
uniref:SFRICE_032548 n=1 Tax=Spodoptera frugiperda TaxID=7108 RepID=A0A2H1VGI5_SPOFR